MNLYADTLYLALGFELTSSEKKTVKFPTLIGLTISGMEKWTMNNFKGIVVKDSGIERMVGDLKGSYTDFELDRPQLKRDIEARMS